MILALIQVRDKITTKTQKMMMFDTKAVNNETFFTFEIINL
jgi:hypothetical protein